MFLLIIVLNTLDTKYHITKPQIVHRKHFEKDLKYCKMCFENQISHCLNIFEEIELDDEFSVRQLLGILPERACQRQNQLIKLKNSNVKLITKYFAYQKVQKLGINLKKDEIRKEFIRQIENLQDMQYAPLKTLDKFIDNLHKFHSNLTNITIWLYMLLNIQPIILPWLFQRDLPVPQTYAVCGFTMFQEYAGEDLYHFFKTDLKMKFRIAQQLLEAALKFSYGFDNYRLYITDLTADNIVYDKSRNKLTFIDLDTIFVVDSSQVKYSTSIHKHQYIECFGCFAYSADEIASYNISDLNIFSVCQFLREDLYKDLTKGFLYPISQEVTSAYPSLKQLLHKCVDCPDNSCRERFTVAGNLIKIFKEISQAEKI